MKALLIPQYFQVGENLDFQSGKPMSGTKVTLMLTLKRKSRLETQISFLKEQEKGGQ